MILVIANDNSASSSDIWSNAIYNFNLKLKLIQNVIMFPPYNIALRRIELIDNLNCFSICHLHQGKVRKELMHDKQRNSVDFCYVANNSVHRNEWNASFFSIGSQSSWFLHRPQSPKRLRISSFCLSRAKTLLWWAKTIKSY